MEKLDFGTMEPNQVVSIFKNAKLDLNLVLWEVLQKIYDASCFRCQRYNNLKAIHNVLVSGMCCI